MKPAVAHEQQTDDELWAHAARDVYLRVAPEIPLDSPPDWNGTDWYVALLAVLSLMPLADVQWVASGGDFAGRPDTDVVLQRTDAIVDWSHHLRRDLPCHPHDLTQIQSIVLGAARTRHGVLAPAHHIPAHPCLAD